MLLLGTLIRRLLNAINAQLKKPIFRKMPSQGFEERLSGTKFAIIFFVLGKYTT